MNGNDGTGNTVERDEWQTPQWLFDKLNKQYNFNFDCCATKENTKTNLFSEEDFLDLNFENTVGWMNPPFSKANYMFNHFFKVMNKGVCIYRCDNMETKVWQEIIFKNASWIFIPVGRICYEGMKGNNSRFPSALIGFNVDIPKTINGWCILNKKQIKSSGENNGSN